MRFRCLLAPVVLAALASTARGQHPIPPEVSQFAFLVGQWELTAKPPAKSFAEKIHGVRSLSGTWRASRALDGLGIDDEMRIVDPQGNPHLVVHSLRMYDASAKRWQSATFDVFGLGLLPMSGAWDGKELTVTSNALGADKKGLLRCRFHDIAPNTFAFTEDRSADGGATWTELFTVEAKRVTTGASR